MIDFRPTIDRAFAKLNDLSSGKSVGAIVQGDVMFSGTQLHDTRDGAVRASANAEMSEADRLKLSEAQSVVNDMARDLVDQINKGFLS